jgi:predicted dehydrogenase
VIDIAVVGLGWWGRNVVGLLADSDRLHPVLGVDIAPEGRAWAEERGLAVTGELQDALDDPRIDAVVLCSPHRFHADQIVAAAGAGKHVFCEKPFALTTHDVDRALAAVAAAGVCLGIGHERRFEPPVM